MRRVRSHAPELDTGSRPVRGKAIVIQVPRTSSHTTLVVALTSLWPCV